MLLKWVTECVNNLSNCIISVFHKSAKPTSSLTKLCWSPAVLQLMSLIDSLALKFGSDHTKIVDADLFHCVRDERQPFEFKSRHLLWFGDGCSITRGWPPLSLCVCVDYNTHHRKSTHGSRVGEGADKWDHIAAWSPPTTPPTIPDAASAERRPCRACRAETTATGSALDTKLLSYKALLQY